MTLNPLQLRKIETLFSLPPDQIDLCETLFQISCLLEPGLKPDKTRKAFNGYKQDIERCFTILSRNSTPIEALHGALRQILHIEAGFCGEEEAYQDLSHMSVISLMKKKAGSSLILAMLYTMYAREMEASAHIIDFPGMCLVRIDKGAQRMIFDPCNGAVSLKPNDLRQMLKVMAGADAELKPRYFEDLSNKTILIRHLSAIKMHFIRVDKVERAVEMLQVLRTLEPQSDVFWREEGLLQARLGELPPAIRALKTALKYTTDHHTQRHTQQMIDSLNHAIH